MHIEASDVRRIVVYSSGEADIVYNDHTFAVVPKEKVKVHVQKQFQFGELIADLRNVCEVREDWIKGEIEDIIHGIQNGVYYK